MQIKLSGHDFKYEASNISVLAFPLEKIVFVPEGDDFSAGNFPHIESILSEASSLCRIETEKGVFQASSSIDSGNKKSAVTRAIYLCALDSGVKPLPWGAMTGIRPAKYAREIFERCGSEKQTLEALETEYLISPEKAELALDICKISEPLRIYGEHGRVSLYISIPFCPSRCAYCSFVSQSVEKANKLLEPYLEKLFSELSVIAGFIKRRGLTLISVYIGGGTPGILSDEQLERLLCAVEKRFDLNELAEYTFESGRPEVSTRAKAEILCKHGITRVCINPQTTNDRVLSAIGRRHTSDQFFGAYRQFAEYGFKAINCDLIAGLPEDSFSSFKKSLDDCVTLGAQNITVHTLAVKNSSFIKGEGSAIYHLPPPSEIECMLDYSIKMLISEGYLPYYTYRQKNVPGSFENTGWAKPGTECIYNVMMMDELGTVIGAGSGSATKLVCGRRIERLFNVKYPYEYTDSGREFSANRLDKLYDEVFGPHHNESE